MWSSCTGQEPNANRALDVPAPFRMCLLIKSSSQTSHDIENLFVTLLFAPANNISIKVLPLLPRKRQQRQEPAEIPCKSPLVTAAWLAANVGQTGQARKKL